MSWLSAGATVAWSVGSFIAGAFVGAFLSHRFAFGRDVHKEWRAARDPIIKDLDGQVIEPYHMTHVDFSDLAWRFTRPALRKQFDALVSEYETALKDENNMRHEGCENGFVGVNTYYIEPDKVRGPARRLIEFLKRL